jgi:hypothetical protein
MKILGGYWIYFSARSNLYSMKRIDRNLNNKLRVMIRIIRKENPNIIKGTYHDYIPNSD